jgi:hypothetical protein
MTKLVRVMGKREVTSVALSYEAFTLVFSEFQATNAEHAESPVTILIRRIGIFFNRNYCLQCDHDHLLTRF